MEAGMRRRRQFTANRPLRPRSIWIRLQEHRKAYGALFLIYFYQLAVYHLKIVRYPDRRFDCE